MTKEGEAPEGDGASPGEVPRTPLASVTRDVPGVVPCAMGVTAGQSPLLREPVLLHRVPVLEPRGPRRSKWGVAGRPRDPRCRGKARQRPHCRC